MENIPPLLEIEERQQIQQRLSMKGATEPLFAKATYNERREGLGSPQWHFTMYPSVLLTEFSQNKDIQEMALTNDIARCKCA